ncbi:hypothetical protein F4780DRAFT_777052 [Xylariomycetidae sp. FL0641]|nr:hypothetical protein F4780DRAFT_777052 [Xylariomycetidae sp. FL0641]
MRSHTTIGHLSERNSPASTHSFPMMGTTRPLLTPRSPLASSASHSTYRGSEAQQSYFPSAPSDSSPGMGQSPGSRHIKVESQDGRTASTLAPLIPYRPAAQPMLGQEPDPRRPHPTSQSRQQSGFASPTFSGFSANNRPGPPPPTSQPRQQAGFVSTTFSGFPVNNRSAPSPSPVDSRWSGEYGSQNSTVRGTPVPLSDSTSMQQHIGNRNSMLQANNAMFRIQPFTGDELLVPVDFVHGSRQADEKRHRNAEASSRFRQRKKEKEAKQEDDLKWFKTENGQLQRRVLELEAERDRYRQDRDRLRSIVHQTPGISELAYQGPQSPPHPIRVTGAYPERSPLVSAPLPSPHMPRPYGAHEPDAGERAYKRRRTDSQLDYANAPPHAPASGLLPTAPPSYTSYSQPATPSEAGRTSRLPPLRLDQQPGTPPSSGPTVTTPLQGHFSTQREPYESGWATRPSGPPGPGSR